MKRLRELVSGQARWPLGLILAIGPLGCSEDPGSRDGGGSGSASGKADDASDDAELGEAQRAHLEAVGRCEFVATRDKDHTSELRYDAIAEIEQERLSCIGTANDGVVDTMEATLTASSSSVAGTVADTFVADRSGRTSFCKVLLDATPHAGGKAAPSVSVSCAAQGELHLAEAIQAFADLGGPTAVRPDVGARYPDCWQEFLTTFDALPSDESAVPVELEATRTLYTCVHQELLNDATLEVAVRIAENFPGRDETDVLNDTERSFYAMAATQEDTCIVLGAASPAAGTPEAELEFRRCQVSAVMRTGNLVGYVIPELAPTDEPSDSSTSSGTGGTTTDGTTGGDAGSTGSPGSTSSGGTGTTGA